MMRRLVLSLACFALGLFGSQLIDPHHQQYAYVDVEQLITELHSHLKANQLPEAEIRTEIELAKKIFIYSVDEYSKKHNIVIITSHKVIAGATNLTSYFSQLVINEL